MKRMFVCLWLLLVLIPGLALAENSNINQRVQNEIRSTINTMFDADAKIIGIWQYGFYSEHGAVSWAFPDSEIAAANRRLDNLGPGQKPVAFPATSPLIIDRRLRHGFLSQNVLQNKGIRDIRFEDFNARTGRRCVLATQGISNDTTGIYLVIVQTHQSGKAGPSGAPGPRGPRGFRGHDGTPGRDATPTYLRVGPGYFTLQVNDTYYNSPAITAFLDHGRYSLTAADGRSFANADQPYGLDDRLRYAALRRHFDICYIDGAFMDMRKLVSANDAYIYRAVGGTIGGGLRLKAEPWQLTIGAGIGRFNCIAPGYDRGCWRTGFTTNASLTWKFF